MAQWIGWLAAFILLMTIGRQVWTQWRSGTAAGVSKWLFAGQIGASTCFIIYSIAVSDTVFIATNSLMLVAAVFGQMIYWRNRRRQGARVAFAESPRVEKK